MSEHLDIEAIGARVRDAERSLDDQKSDWCRSDLARRLVADIAALLAEVARLRACCERLLVESARLRVLEHAVRAGGACSENVMSARAAIAAMGAVALPEKATPSMRHAAAIEEQRVVAGEANTERYARLWRAMLAAWREETGR